MSGRKMILGSLGIGWALLWFTANAWAQVSMEQFLTKQALVKFGEKSYLNRCSGCHGVDGKATTASPFLNPKPRDLTSGVFKFRSTPNGTLPTDQDLIRTITQGVLGTSMPSFKFVPEAEKLALVAYIKTLSPAWEDEQKKGEPMYLPNPPRDLFSQKDVFLERARAGREIFKNTCALCHGYDGKGKGPAAATLKDDWGETIVPIDFTKPFIKSGWGVRDIYKVMATGLNGAPMPAFAEALGEERTWDIIAYVMYLRGERAEVYAEGTIPPLEAPAPIPDDEEDYYED